MRPPHAFFNSETRFLNRNEDHNSSICLHLLVGQTKTGPCNISLPSYGSVGLASHWPCVTDNSGITTYGLTTIGREEEEIYCAQENKQYK